MRPLPSLRLLILPLALAACVAGPAPDRPLPPDGVAPASCGASRLEGFVGQPVAALNAQYLPETVRIIRPGDAVTEDYSPSRLNVVLDDKDIITEFWCG